MSINDLRSRASASARRKSGLSKGVAVDDQVGTHVVRPDLADRPRRLARNIFQQWDRHLVGEGQVELARNETEERSRAVRHDRVFDAVEIGATLFPIVRISRQLDRLVRFEFDKFEGTSADRMAAHVAR